MQLFKIIHFLFGFIFGSVFTSIFCTFAFTNAIKHASLEETAKRAVGDVASAYEGQLEKSGVWDKFNSCLRENARLKTRAFIHTGVDTQ